MCCTNGEYCDGLGWARDADAADAAGPLNDDRPPVPVPVLVTMGGAGSHDDWGREFGVALLLRLDGRLLPAFGCIAVVLLLLALLAGGGCCWAPGALSVGDGRL